MNPALSAVSSSQSSPSPGATHVVRVQLFAATRQLAGRAELDIELPRGATVGDLRRALAERVPALAPLAAGILMAVDAEYARDDQVLREDAQAACIPPVSGG